MIDEEKTRRRLRDIREALDQNQGISFLARRWRVSRGAVCNWLDDHVDATDRRLLGDNGNLQRGITARGFELEARLAMICLLRKSGWTWARIASAIGCSINSVYTLAAKHMPDGIDAASIDFEDAA